MLFSADIIMRCIGTAIRKKYSDGTTQKYINSELNLNITLGGGGGGHWLVRMEWHPDGWLVCLRLLNFPCTIKSLSSLLALAHAGGPGKRAVKRLWWLI